MEVRPRRGAKRARHQRRGRRIVPRFKRRALADEARGSRSARRALAGSRGWLRAQGGRGWAGGYRGGSMRSSRPVLGRAASERAMRRAPPSGSGAMSRRMQAQESARRSTRPEKSTLADRSPFLQDGPVQPEGIGGEGVSPPTISAERLETAVPASDTARARSPQPARASPAQNRARAEAERTAHRRIVNRDVPSRSGVMRSGSSLAGSKPLGDEETGGAEPDRNSTAIIIYQSSTGFQALILYFFDRGASGSGFRLRSALLAGNRTEPPPRRDSGGSLPAVGRRRIVAVLISGRFNRCGDGARRQREGDPCEAFGTP